MEGARRGSVCAGSRGVKERLGSAQSFGISFGIGIGIGICIGIGIGICISIDIGVGIGIGIGLGIGIGIGSGMGMGIGSGIDVDIGIGICIGISIVIGISIGTGAGIGIGISTAWPLAWPDVPEFCQHDMVPCPCCPARAWHPGPHCGTSRVTSAPAACDPPSPAAAQAAGQGPGCRASAVLAVEHKAGWVPGSAPPSPAAAPSLLRGEPAAAPTSLWVWVATPPPQAWQRAGERGYGRKRTSKSRLCPAGHGARRRGRADALLPGTGLREPGAGAPREKPPCELGGN